MVIFFEIDLCSATSFERSQRELSIDVAQHKSSLKIYQNTYYPRFSFTPKTGTAFLKTGVLFLLCGAMRTSREGVSQRFSFPPQVRHLFSNVRKTRGSTP